MEEHKTPTAEERIAHFRDQIARHTPYRINMIRGC